MTAVVALREPAGAADATAEARARMTTARAGTDPYRGPDRRGIVGTVDPPSGAGIAVLIAATTATVPFGAAALMSLGGLDVTAWSTGTTNAAFVVFGLAAVLLVVQWRLLGELKSAYLFAATVLTGLLYVPIATRFEPVSGYVGAVRGTSLALALGVCVLAIRGPDVRADFHPTRFAGWATAAVMLLAIPLGLSAAHVVTLGRPGLLDVADLAETIVCVAIAGLLFATGARQSRLLVGMGAALLAIAGASAFRLAAFGGGWSRLPSLFVLVGGVEFAAVVGAELHDAINSVVLYDVRGRRRWEAAESELTDTRSNFQGQRHDVKSMLSAMDGTLLVLARQRRQLPDGEVDQLITAVREEVQWLRERLVADERNARSYDLSELVRAIARVRRAGSERIRCELDQSLEMEGHPDRLAVIINNLLANAAVHAPAADVSITTRLEPDPRGQIVVLDVSDNGPGLPDADLEHAFGRSWRGTRAVAPPGSGFGLFQCRELVEAEGGTIRLLATDDSAPPCRRGLTARVRLPVRRAQ